MTSDRGPVQYAGERLERALQRLAAGERGALAEIYEATNRKLFGIVLRILGDRKDAEDALQDVYLSLWQKAAQFDRTRASPVGWLAVMARNRAIDTVRRRRDTGAPIESAADVPDAQPLADDVLIDRERTERIHACLAALEIDQRSAIRSAFLDGRTYASLAALGGVPLGTMKSRIRRGLARLKTCLEGDR